MNTTRQVAKILRSNGRTVVTGVPKHDDKSNFWVIGDGQKAVVLNVQVHSILGCGCFDHPDYAKTKADLRQEACDLLAAAGVSYTLSLIPDQIFLSGFESKSYTQEETARWRKLNNI